MQFAVVVREQDQAAGIKGGVYKLLAGLDDILRRTTHRQRFRHLIQMAGTLLAIAGNPRLIAYSGGQITDQ
ncbi:hypothetical protein D3C79_1032770 [compost metagenome]